jgi:hypothetical protein
MEKKGLNESFRIEREEFLRRTGISELVPYDYRQIISPRQVRNVRAMAVMRKSQLEDLMKSIPLVEDHLIKPYNDSQVYFADIDPTRLHVSQTFLLARKILFFLNGFGQFYQKFCSKSISKLQPHYLLGEDEAGIPSVAIYLPPIIERREKEDLLIDGNHRSCICGGVSTSIVSIVVRDPTVPPPYTGIPWHTNIVNEKPRMEDRYVNFNPALLKDFNYVGIDG